MPRANCYIVAGNVYHLTHRCHDRAFLLRFARDRDGYRGRLREAVLSVDASLLTYNITRNHVHLLVYAQQTDQVGKLMQEAAGRLASDYNRRKRRSGAFWEGRYQATMVGSGEYLWECLKYIELNMVRCGVVEHPADWAWSGYGELMGWKKRNRLLDVGKLLWLLRCGEVAELRTHRDAALSEAILNGWLERQAKWTQAIAVGDRAFIQAMEERIGYRQKMTVSEESGTWVLQEEYGAPFVPEKRAIDSL